MNMKNAKIFEFLVDLLFVFHCIGLAGFLFIFPLGIFTTQTVNVKMEDFNYNINELPQMYWVFIGISFIAYIIFLMGLYFLRKVAKQLISKQIFSSKIILNLKKSGKYLLASGMSVLIMYILIWLFKLLNGKIELVYGDNVMVPFFLMIVGLFFIIHSKALLIAKETKEENDLTI